MEAELCLHAHSRNKQGRRHGLAEHLRSVAHWAGVFAEPFGAAEVARWLGLVHDLGKAAEPWQQRLLEVEGTDERVQLDHKAAGAQFLVRELGFDAYASTVVGHHGGLVSLADFEAFLSSPARETAQEDAALARLRSVMPELRAPAVPSWPAVAGNRLEGELLARMLFSALVDADHLDTQVHFGKRQRHVADPVDMAALLDRFEDGRKRKLAARSPSPIDPLRGEVYDACVAAAALAPGFFKLAAPTGLGKTISSAGFALHHTVAHGQRRVVVAVPFVSITEQNAAQYRALLGSSERDAMLLEHHSSVDLDGPGSRFQRLAAENWDAPFVVTTTVQLLHSLHERRPWAMRKLHRLAGSVIVLDEIQALPVHLLIPILTMLRQLVEHFGVTVLLASATQPEFWDLAPLKEVAPTEILADPGGLQHRLRALRPVRYQWMTRPRPSLPQVAAAVVTHPQALVVVNTVARARAVFELIEAGAAQGARVRHLSTRMCPQHRRYVLDEVTRLLREHSDKPVYLISTQLIEAGVDVDFPVVFREMAPEDSILQAAGRSNREGLRPEGGLVVIFAPDRNAMPASYALPVAETWRWFGPGKADPDDLDALSCFYRGYYGMLTEQAMGAQVVDARRRWNFPAVTEGFRMIEDGSVPVVVAYQRPDEPSPAPVRAWLDRLRRDPPDDHVLLRRLQPFTASLRAAQLTYPWIAARLRPVIADLYEWVGPYDPRFGIDIPPQESP